jgi:hypothetical protein
MRAETRLQAEVQHPVQPSSKQQNDIGLLQGTKNQK